MLHDLKIALRNVFRNTRRSVVTIIAVMLSCAGLILFAGYVAWAFRSAETLSIVLQSHIQLFKRGFYEKGAGNPAHYAIDDYERIKELLQNDPVIAPRLEFVTGQILFNGIVSYSNARTSSTCVGFGFFPEDDWRLLHWNPYRLVSPTDLPANKDLYHSTPELASDDPDGVSVGSRLARTLEINLDQKIGARASQSASATPATETTKEDFSALSEQNYRTGAESSARPSLELICAPPGGGMPNAMTVNVRKVFTRGTKELDNQLVKIDIHRASDLLFPGEKLKVTSVLLVLKRTNDVPAVIARLKDLVSKKDIDLDYETWDQLRPYYRQLTQLFRTMFTFMFCIIAVIVTFTIYNTLSMGIAERVGEIGTLRAMGVTRAGIRRAFLLEGFLLGLIGGLLGVAIAIAIGIIVNALQIVYIPPGGAFYTKLEVLVLRAPLILVICFAASLLAALCSAILPAHKASRMIIVDALRH